MRSRRRIALILAVATSALTVTAVAPAETVVNQTIPFSGTTFNDCTDEIVFVEGKLHTTNRMTVSGNRIHQGIHIQSTGVKGTTLTGSRYVEKDVELQQTNFSTNLAPMEFTVVRSHNLTRLGEDGAFVDGDDLRVHVIVHMTVNANGFVTADKSEFRSECQ